MKALVRLLVLGLGASSHFVAAQQTESCPPQCQQTFKQCRHYADEYTRSEQNWGALSLSESGNQAARATRNNELTIPGEHGNEKKLHHEVRYRQCAEALQACLAQCLSYPSGQPSVILQSPKVSNGLCKRDVSGECITPKPYN
jgi:hypothetical protein